MTSRARGHDITIIMERSSNSKHYYYTQIKTIPLSLTDIRKYSTKTLVCNSNKIFLCLVLFKIEFQLQCIKLSDSAKFTISNPISFDKAKKLKISKPDSNNNVSTLKANK